MIPFVGPSYQLKTKRQGVQRSINLMPTPVESGSGKAGVFLAPVPGLRQFSGEGGGVDPDIGYSISTYYSTGDLLDETYTGGDSTLVANGISCAGVPGIEARTTPTYTTLTLSFPSVFNLGGFFPGMFEEYGITEGLFYGQTSGRSITIPLNAGGAFGFGSYEVIDTREELWFTGVGGACIFGIYDRGANSDLRQTFATDDEAYFAILMDEFWPTYPIHFEPLDLYWRVTLNYTIDDVFINSELVFVDRAEYLANI